MTVVEKEQFAFNILNQLYDDYTLHDDDYKALVVQIQETNTLEEMDKILTYLQGALLICMRESISLF